MILVILIAKPLGYLRFYFINCTELIIGAINVKINTLQGGWLFHLYLIQGMLNIMTGINKEQHSYKLESSPSGHKRADSLVMHIIF